MRTVSNRGFTLLELVMVLAILAVVTALAARELSQLEDQRRFEASQKNMRDIEEAVLGSPDDRAADGTRIVSGFLADMGRLPATVLNSTLDPSNPSVLTLEELWNPATVAPYGVRQATTTNLSVTSNAADFDNDIYVAGGWRGPYLRLPLGAAGLQDAWGNRMTAPDSTGHVRLFDSGGIAVNTFGQQVWVVQHLGANGVVDTDPATPVYNQDVSLDFRDNPASSIYRVSSSVTCTVQMLEHDGSASSALSETGRVTVRVFGPGVASAAKIDVQSTSNPTLVTDAPITLPSTVTVANLTAGPRVVRAYFSSDGINVTKSAIKYVTLTAGPNLIPLTIYRP